MRRWCRGIVKRFVLTTALLTVAPPVFGEDTVEVDSVETPDSVTTPVVDSVGPDSIAVDSIPPVDTVIFSPGGMLGAYSAVSDTTDREQRLCQKPMWGLFKSMVLPGWGQLGNRRYIKAAVYFGLEAWMVGGAMHYHKRASDFRRAYDATPLDYVGLRNDYYSLWRDRQDERNKYTWFAMIVAFVSMFDAYVDAHLSGFPRKDGNEDFALQFKPADKSGVAAALAYRF